MKAIRTSFAPFLVSISGVHDLNRFAGENPGPSVSHMISLLDPETPDPKEYAAITPDWHERFHLHDIIEPHPEKVMPTKQDVAAILDLADHVHGEKVEHLLVHCWLGMSRSFATTAIILGRHQPEAAEEIVLELARHRNPCWPNSLILGMADEMMGTGGGFVRGARKVYSQVIGAHPHLVKNLQAAGRAAELPPELRDQKSTPAPE